MPLLPVDPTAYFTVANVRTSIMCIRVGRRIRIVKHDNHCNCPINYIKLRGLDEYKAFEFHFIKKEQGEYKWQH